MSEYTALLNVSDFPAPTVFMPAKSKAASSKHSFSKIGFEAKLWLTADKLRNNMGAAEYKHPVLGLSF